MLQIGEFCAYVALIAGAFLLGGVMFCRLIPLWIKGVDVTENTEDHNPGATNAFSACGAKIGFLCLLCDLFKGYLPAYIAVRLLPTNNFMFSLVMVAPVLGHAVGVFNGFVGGKCIATSFGVAFATLRLSPAGLILAVIYIVLIGICRMEHRLGSIVTFAVFGLSSLILTCVTGRPWVGVGFVFISAVAIFRHIRKSEKKDKKRNVEDAVPENT